MEWSPSDDYWCFNCIRNINTLKRMCTAPVLIYTLVLHELNRKPTEEWLLPDSLCVCQVDVWRSWSGAILNLVCMWICALSQGEPGWGGIESLWARTTVGARPTHWKRPWCWERLKAGEGNNRGWDSWMASLTQWTWVWVNSGSWWWTGRPGVLPSMGLQKVRHDWVTELNWTES